jgi:hypothetical protein
MKKNQLNEKLAKVKKRLFGTSRRWTETNLNYDFSLVGVWQ